MKTASRRLAMTNQIGTTRTIASSVIAGALALLGTAAAAPLPKETGWSGFLLVGGAYSHLASNLVSGTKLGDLSNQTISSLSASPDSKSAGFATVNFELAYTWADSRTQVYVGNALADLLTLDLTSQLGVRQEVGKNGTVYAALVFSGLPTEVWSDPYVINTPREVTDRTSSGVRLGWDEILGSNFNFQLTQRKIEIDNERSGTLGGLGLTPAQQQLLNREGDLTEMNVNYRFKSGKQFWQPELIYKEHDGDGRAMSYDGMGFQLTHGYNGERFATAFNVIAASHDYDATNPIYGKTREDDLFGIGLTIFDRKLIPAKGWSATATVAYYEIDSNIDFYDTEFTIIQAGVFYRF